MWKQETVLEYGATNTVRGLKACTSNMPTKYRDNCLVSAVIFKGMYVVVIADCARITTFLDDHICMYIRIFFYFIEDS